jgi:hypothetical protein
MIRRSGGVPDGWGERLRRIAGVTAVTRATRAQALLRATGVRTVRAAFAVPLDTLVIRPDGYAAMLPAAQRRAMRRLGPGRAVLSPDLGVPAPRPGRIDPHAHRRAPPARRGRRPRRPRALRRAGRERRRGPASAAAACRSSARSPATAG